MLERTRGLSLLAMVLAVPFLLRPRGDRAIETGDAVVVVTPHNEAIRHEFGRAFREHVERTTGRLVHVDWRVPGGTNEIGRFLASEYTASFEHHWKVVLGRPWTTAIASAFSNPAVEPSASGPDPRDERRARAAFLGSDVGIGADVLFGGGSAEFIAHAAAGRLVDSGIVTKHPEVFGEGAIPADVGGEPYWDKGGRWIGACLSGFGICYNRDVLDRLGIGHAPSRWSDLAEPALFGQVALADPSRSGSAVKTFEMVIQQEMNERLAEIEAEGASESSADGQTRTRMEERAATEGWARAMRLIRRIGANARYFTDAATKIPLEISMGDAAAGMCIDFYGRFQSVERQVGEAQNHDAMSRRLGFEMPKGGTSIGADPIGLLRGAPHRALALDFIEFVLSAEGQKLWDFSVDAPGGPEKYALRRLPILPELYAPAYAASRSDPNDDPYEQARHFTYRARFTGSLFGTIAFVIRVMCVDTQDDLSRAWRELIGHGSPPAAVARFDDIALVDYQAATGMIRSTLASSRPLDEASLATRLVEALRAQYREVAMLARKGQ